jgi:hypothetical protein
MEERDPILVDLPTYTAASLHSAAVASTDRLFFLSYRHPESLRPQWHLVQIDFDCTDDSHDICGNPAESGIYYVHFFQRHPDDSDEPDPTARWWPEWHKYTTDPDGIIDYGDRIIFSPSANPDPTRYIGWADTVSLLNPDVYILGPFDFNEPTDNPPDRTPSYRQYVPPLFWHRLHALCLERGIATPMLAMPPPDPTTLQLPT